MSYQSCDERGSSNVNLNGNEIVPNIHKEAMWKGGLENLILPVHIEVKDTMCNLFEALNKWIKVQISQG